MARPEKQPELPSGGYLLPGGAAISALLVGIALAVGLAVLVFSGSAWNTVATMHLARSGSVAEGFDAAVRVVSDEDGRTAADKVFAEIEVGRPGAADEIVPVELLAPAHGVDPDLAPGWHAAVAPYADGFAVRYDPRNADLAVAVIDVERAVRPGTLILPLTLFVLGVSLVGRALARRSDFRGRRRRERQASLPGMVSGSGPGAREV